MMRVLEGCFGWRPSNMPRAEEKNTLVWLWTLKLVMIIPVAIAAFKARSMYNFVKRHEELQKSPPYDENVLISHLLIYVGVSAVSFVTLKLQLQTINIYVRLQWLMYAADVS